MPKKTFAVADLPEGDDELRARLAELTSAELSEAYAALEEAFDEQYDAIGDEPTSEQLESLEKIGAQMQVVQATQQEKQAEAEANKQRLAQLKQQRAGKTEEPQAGGGDGDGSTDDPDPAEPSPEPELVTATSEEVLTAAIATAVESAVTSAADAWLKPAKDLNQRIRFGTMKQYAPDAKVHEARSEAVITASANIPGFTQGGQLATINDLAAAFHARAKMLPVGRTGTTEHVPIASLKREFNYMMDERATVEDMQEVIKAATDVEVLTAAGGWCAPSEISYDFYNIVCEDGMWDVPTVGLQRGGTQYPISPSFGDLAGQEGIVWTWTEQDDIDAVDSASVVKPCVRLECPSFIDRRKDCDGFCVTAGNLVDFAYPELVANWLRLVMAIRAHATNARLLDIAINGGGSGDDIGPAMPVNHAGLLGNVTAKLLTSIELSVTDYREKFAMCDDAVLEGVFPRWAQMVIRADLANREGIDFLNVTDGMIADWFNTRDIRAQFVGDWQVRTPGYPGAATALTDLPPELDYLIYPAGTYVRGNGMTLDLGVVRDSVLNETNDHTAAWTEECYALLKPGHESRLITVDVCAAGEVGAASIECVAS
jgi:hypothetical protein